MKKNDQAYLLDLKIDIHTKNDSHYQELALLLDKPSFLDMLPNLRERYKVSEFFPLDQYEEMLNSYEEEHFFKKTKVAIDQSKYTNLEGMKVKFPDFFEFINSSGNFLPETLDAECNLICYTLNRPPYFVEPIKQAIFCKATDALYFKPTQAGIVDFSIMGAWPTLERVAIFVSPTSTYDEVKAELREAKKLMSQEESISFYKPRGDTTPNIRKYREWYWRKLGGDSYKKISDDWTNRSEINQYDSGTDDNMVLKGIQAYKRLLEL